MKTVKEKRKSSMLKDWRKNYAEMCFRWPITFPIPKGRRATSTKSSYFYIIEIIYNLDQSQGAGDCVEQGGAGHGCPHYKMPKVS